MKPWQIWLASGAVALVGGFTGAAIYQVSGLGHAQTRAYLVDNPDVLPAMADALMAQEAAGRLAQVADEVKSPFPGAVLGNPDGSRTLVKFTDYACGYCRASLPDVERLVANDPELKVVIREWPVFPGSEGAARMALAAAQQGRFEQFHKAMFAAGTPSPETVERAARAAGLDLDAARKFAASDEASAALARNDALAEALGFQGTPSWVAGDAVLNGMVGYDRLAEALARSDAGA